MEYGTLQWNEKRKHGYTEYGSLPSCNLCTTWPSNHICKHRSRPSDLILHGAVCCIPLLLSCQVCRFCSFLWLPLAVNRVSTSMSMSMSMSGAVRLLYHTRYAVCGFFVAAECRMRAVRVASALDLFESSFRFRLFIRAKRVSNCYMQEKKNWQFVCVWMFG